MEGPNGNFVARVEISQLTEELVIVEVRKKGGDSVCYDNIWKKKLMPKLSGLVYDSKLTQTVAELDTVASAE